MNPYTSTNQNEGCAYRIFIYQNCPETTHLSHVSRISQFSRNKTATCRIRNRREHQDLPDPTAEEARALLPKRRKIFDYVETITTFTQDPSELTEKRTFIKSFFKEDGVAPQGHHSAVPFRAPEGTSGRRFRVL